MSNVMRICVVSFASLAALFLGRTAAAEDTAMATVTTPVASNVVKSGIVTARATLMGIEPLNLEILSKRRGAADVYNDMQLKGVVADNRAINVTTGSNIITDGAFSGAAGVPMVVQNSGNNVLIQNATIVNVQVK